MQKTNNPKKLQIAVIRDLVNSQQAAPASPSLSLLELPYVDSIRVEQKKRTARI